VIGQLCDEGAAVLPLAWRTAVTSDASTVSINLSDLLENTPSFIGGVLKDVSQDFRAFIRSHQTTFTQTNLVSDGLVPAVHIDPNLINPWGVSYSSTSPFWVSDNGTGVSTLYDGKGVPQPQPNPLVVTIATPPGQDPGTAAPTGQVFNTDGDGFQVSGAGSSAPSVFMFATEDGTISGWNPAVDRTHSILAVDNSTNPDAGADGQGAVYKGLTIGDDNGQTLLYAANFRHGTVDVFDDKFNQVNSLTDPSLPGGYAPFNVQVLDGKLFVTYAQQDAAKHDDVAGAHHGFVDEFDLNGNLLTLWHPADRSIHHGDWQSRRVVLAHLPVICWSGTSVTARSTLLTRRPTRSWGRCSDLTANQS
jgi:uncharacterized protein (TIGR03118 family)